MPPNAQDRDPGRCRAVECRESVARAVERAREIQPPAGGAAQVFAHGADRPRRQETIAGRAHPAVLLAGELHRAVVALGGGARLRIRPQAHSGSRAARAATRQPPDPPEHVFLPGARLLREAGLSPLRRNVGFAARRKPAFLREAPACELMEPEQDGTNSGYRACRAIRMRAALMSSPRSSRNA